MPHVKVGQQIVSQYIQIAIDSTNAVVCKQCPTKRSQKKAGTIRQMNHFLPMMSNQSGMPGRVMFLQYLLFCHWSYFLRDIYISCQFFFFMSQKSPAPRCTSSRHYVTQSRNADDDTTYTEMSVRSEPRHRTTTRTGHVTPLRTRLPTLPCQY